MPPVYVALACGLMSLALLYLLVDRRRSGDAKARQGEEMPAAAQQATDQLAQMRHQIDCRNKRVRELEALVLRLSARLEARDLNDEDRRLLSDIYHEYGTEGHDYYFGEAPATARDG